MLLDIFFNTIPVVSLSKMFYEMTGGRRSETAIWNFANFIFYLRIFIFRSSVIKSKVPVPILAKTTWKLIMLGIYAVCISTWSLQQWCRVSKYLLYAIYFSDLDEYAVVLRHE